MKTSVNLAAKTGPTERELALEQERTFLAHSEVAFPNIVVESLGSEFEGSVWTRTISGHPISRLTTSEMSVNASDKKGRAAGLQGWMKIVWQLSGSSHFENDDTSFELKPGEATILPMSEQYRLEMRTGFDGLVLAFDPSSKAGWGDLLTSENTPSVTSSAAAGAAGAAVQSLLSNSVGEESDKFALNLAFDVMFRSAADMGAPSEVMDVPKLRRAVFLIEQNLGDTQFSPSDLAREMGMSRRSLYQEFARAGISPASLTKRMRLERAKQEILNRDFANINLTEIALRHGFADSSRFSHAFKQFYGMSPSALRSSRKIQS